MVTIPQTTAKLNITPDDLDKLPVGGQYQSKDGNATATIQRTNKGYEFTANCDSLTLLVTELQTEVYRLNRKNTELKTLLNEQKTVEVNKLTRWQSVRITVGDISLALIGIALLFGAYKLFKKLKII